MECLLQTQTTWPMLSFHILENEKENPLQLLHHSCITILQHTTILVCLKASSVNNQTVRILSGLLMKILREAYLENNSALRKSD